MQKLWCIGVIIVLSLCLSTGCATTQSIGESISSTVGSWTSPVDESLYAQVPEEERDAVKKAEFDLILSQQKLKLAELKMNLASERENYGDYGRDLAKKRHKEAEIAVDIAKLEAIQKEGLGDSEKAIEILADLKAKKLGLKADQVKIEGKIATTQSRINDLLGQIQTQEESIKALEVGGRQPEEAVDQPEETTTEPAGEEE